MGVCLRVPAACVFRIGASAATGPSRRKRSYLQRSSWRLQRALIWYVGTPDDSQRDPNCAHATTKKTNFALKPKYPSDLCIFGSGTRARAKEGKSHPSKGNLSPLGSEACAVRTLLSVHLRTVPFGDLKAETGRTSRKRPSSWQIRQERHLDEGRGSALRMA